MNAWLLVCQLYTPTLSWVPISWLAFSMLLQGVSMATPWASGLLLLPLMMSQLTWRCFSFYEAIF